MKVGKTRRQGAAPSEGSAPAMEPDHEGREDTGTSLAWTAKYLAPQWSPTMKVGKTPLHALTPPQ